VVPTLIDELVRHLIVEELQVGKIRLPVKFSEKVADLVSSKFRTANFARTISPGDYYEYERLRKASPVQDLRPPQDAEHAGGAGKRTDRINIESHEKDSCSHPWWRLWRSLRGARVRKTA